MEIISSFATGKLFELWKWRKVTMKINQIPLIFTYNCSFFSLHFKRLNFLTIYRF